jgi:hypothetical protein
VAVKIQRFGQTVEADAAFFAAAGIDLDAKRSALTFRTNAVDRHHLLASLVELLFRLRNERPDLVGELIETGRLHIAELPTLLPELRRHRELTHARMVADEAARAARLQCKPRPLSPFDPNETFAIDTFFHLRVVLCELGRFDEARALGRQAVAVGYADECTLAAWDNLIEKCSKGRHCQQP